MRIRQLMTAPPTLLSIFFISTASFSLGYESDLTSGVIVQCLMEGQLSNQYLKIFTSLLDRLSKLHMIPMQHMMQFPPDHPVEEVGRQLMAVLIKHLGRVELEIILLQ